MWKNYLIFLVVTFLVAFMAAACRAFSLGPVSLFCSFTIMAVYTYFALLKSVKLNSLYAFLIILGVIFANEFLPRILDDTSIRTLYSSISIAIGCLFGYVTFRTNGKTKKTVSALCAALFITLYTTIGYTYWYDWLHDLYAKKFHYYDNVESVE